MTTTTENKTMKKINDNVIIATSREMKKAGMSDAWIMKEIGMDADELLRYKQLSGLAELFRDKSYSEAII